jgi:hypothetical protein
VVGGGKRVGESETVGDSGVILTEVNGWECLNNSMFGTYGLDISSEKVGGFVSNHGFSQKTSPLLRRLCESTIIELLLMQRLTNLPIPLKGIPKSLDIDLFPHQL